MTQSEVVKMLEKRILSVVLCITYLGLFISACSPSKSPTICPPCSKNDNKGSIASKTDEFNQNTVRNSISSRMPYLNPNVLVNAIANALVPTRKDNPPENPTMNNYPNSHGYFQNPQATLQNQQLTRGSNDQSLPYDLNLRNDVIKRRVRRNDDDDNVFFTTSQSNDPDATLQWQDFLSSFLSKENLDDVNNHEEDEELPVKSQSIDNSDDVFNADTDDQSKSSNEFFNQFRRQLPSLYQRLKLLHELISSPTSNEENQNSNSSELYNTRVRKDFDNLINEKMTDPVEKSDEKANTNRTQVEILTKPDTIKIAVSPNISSLAIEDKKIPVPKS